jgi:glutamyl-Q tRNA(Asp) synthetase
LSAVTRFAPSPTGYLHLGHAFSALFAYENARRAGGRFLLRIEDIDPLRCKPEFTSAIFEDLRWLGLTWEEPVRRQSEHMPDYTAALDRLRGMGVLYPCFCTRREIAEEAAGAGRAPHGVCEAHPSTKAVVSPSRLREGSGVGGEATHPNVQDREALQTPRPPSIPPASGRDAAPALYPGTCRHLLESERREKLAQHGAANWRLDSAKASTITGALTWRDQERGVIAARPEDFGDVVLARKDVPTSYHLSVTVDDHRQGVTLVTRGEDLFRATDIHRLLQALLGFGVPEYLHHPLLTDDSGRRYAKRDKPLTLRAMRAAGVTPEEIRLKLAEIP